MQRRSEMIASTALSCAVVSAVVLASAVLGQDGGFITGRATWYDAGDIYSLSTIHIVP